MLELIDKEATLKKMCESCGYCEKFEKAMRTTHPDFVTDKCNNYKFLAEQPTIKPQIRHGKLIDLDELLKFPIRLDHYDKENGDEHFAYGVEAVLEYAENLSVVEAEPVRHGRWIYAETIGGMKHYYCTSCKERDPGNECFADENQILWFAFCPKCGADMRGEGADGG